MQLRCFKKVFLKISVINCNKYVTNKILTSRQQPSMYLKYERTLTDHERKRELETVKNGRKRLQLERGTRIFFLTSDLTH